MNQEAAGLPTREFQFLIGNLVTKLTCNIACFKVYSFQFLIGNLVTHYSGRNKPLDIRVSIPYRKPSNVDAAPTVLYAIAFQFLIGNLVTYDGNIEPKFCRVFQFLIGNLVTHEWHDYSFSRFSFQFLIGNLVTVMSA